MLIYKSILTSWTELQQNTMPSKAEGSNFPVSLHKTYTYDAYCLAVICRVL